MANFDIKIDTSKVADMFGQTRDIIESALIPGVRAIAVATHGAVLNFAKEKLQDSYKLPIFLGADKSGIPRNLRWIEITPGLWVIEIDDSVAWIENGRAPTSMATEQWLLKPSKDGKWPKRAKDGSLYRPIGFTHFKSKGKLPETNKPAYRTIVENAMKAQGISKGIERHADKSPKLGILHKLQINPPGTQAQIPNMYSRPRTAQEAALSGLKPHSGIFHLKGAVVLQRMVEGKGKKMHAVKETVVFRVVSSKHKAEGRWMYPRVDGINSLKAGYDYANAEIAKLMDRMDNMFRQAQG